MFEYNNHEHLLRMLAELMVKRPSKLYCNHPSEGETICNTVV